MYYTYKCLFISLLLSSCGKFFVKSIKIESCTCLETIMFLKCRYFESLKVTHKYNLYCLIKQNYFYWRWTNFERLIWSVINVKAAKFIKCKLMTDFHKQLHHHLPRKQILLNTLIQFTLKRIHMNVTFVRKCFFRRSYLLQHVKAIHDKIKSFICKECDNSFAENSGLKRYKREIVII